MSNFKQRIRKLNNTLTGHKFLSKKELLAEKIIKEEEILYPSGHIFNPSAIRINHRGETHLVRI